MQPASRMSLFFFNDTATTEIYTLSLHDALPISLQHRVRVGRRRALLSAHAFGRIAGTQPRPGPLEEDRKSTRLNSSHSQISYAVFCLKKKSNVFQRVARPNAGDFNNIVS